MTRELPSGRVTFAFTDVVGSTRALSESPDEFRTALQRLHETITKIAVAHGGVVVSTDGDGAFLAFSTATGAVTALTELQECLAETARHDDGVALRVRAGAHTGDAVPVDDDYVSLAANHAARVADAAGAGQVIVSDAVQRELASPRGIRLGAYELKDIPDPVVLWRIVGDDAPLRATPVRRRNVATPRTSFIGRDEELALLTELVVRPSVVTLTGPGGIGKSRLASQLALAQSDELSGGAWLAELTTVTDPAQVTAAVAASIGVEPGVTVETVARELDTRRDVLLVLDGCEHLIDPVAELAAELVRRCPRLRLLCTSREPLDIDGERVLRLHPLAYGDDGAAARSAEQLFRDRAAAAGAALTDLDAAAVTRVCAQLDGLPLALELAAARTAALPVRELAEALAAGEITLARRSGHRHQRSLRDLVVWSLQRLTDSDATALLALSLFPGRFSRNDATRFLTAVPGSNPRAAPELSRRSLIDLDGDRFRMLLTIRDVAREELRADPVADKAAHHAFVEWALHGCPPSTVRQRNNDDLDTALAVHAALSWGLEAGLDNLYPLMRRLSSWSQESGDSAAVRELALRVLARPLRNDPAEVILQSTALDLLTGLGSGRASTERSVGERARELVRLARASGDTRALYESLATAARALATLGEHDEALALQEEALGVAEREPALAPWRGIELANLALMHYLRGDLNRAEAYNRRSIAVSEAAGDQVTVAAIRCNLAEQLLDRGAPAEAETELRAALACADGTRAPTVLAMALLAEAKARRGEPAEALRVAAEALPALERMAADDPSMADQLTRLRGVVKELPDPNDL